MCLINSLFFKPGTFFFVLINYNIHRYSPSLGLLFFYFSMSIVLLFKISKTSKSIECKQTNDNNKKSRTKKQKEKCFGMK